MSEVMTDWLLFLSPGTPAVVSLRSISSSSPSKCVPRSWSMLGSSTWMNTTSSCVVEWYVYLWTVLYYTSLRYCWEMFLVLNFIKKACGVQIFWFFLTLSSPEVQKHAAAWNQLCRSAALQITTCLLYTAVSSQPLIQSCLSIHQLKTVESSTKWTGLFSD